MIQVSKLTTQNAVGAGHEIYAHIDKPVGCVEFTMKGDHNQRIVVGTAPFIQFAPQEWEDMIGRIFVQMVELWNEKYGNQPVETTGNLVPLESFKTGDRFAYVDKVYTIQTILDVPRWKDCYETEEEELVVCTSGDKFTKSTMVEAVGGKVV